MAENVNMGTSRLGVIDKSALDEHVAKTLWEDGFKYTTGRI